MSSGTRTIQGPIPSSVSHPSVTRRARISRRVLIDRLGGGVITGGGIFIIGCILAILFVIASEALPLFQKPGISPLPAIEAQVDAPPLAMGVDEHREFAYLVTESGIQFVSLKTGRLLSTAKIHSLAGARVISASAAAGGDVLLGLSDGRVMLAKITFAVSFPDGQRRIDPRVVTEDPISVSPDGRAVEYVAYAATETGPVITAVTGGKRITNIAVKEAPALIGPATSKEYRADVVLPIAGVITALVMDNRGENAYAGTSSGEVVRLDLEEPDSPAIAGVQKVTVGRGIGVSVLGFLLGDRTLIVGDTSGAVHSWQLLRGAGDKLALQKMYDFAKHDSAVTSFAPSWRTKGFLTGDASSNIRFHFGTTAETLLAVKGASGAVKAVTLAPKADAILLVDGAGRIDHWEVSNPHPEVTLWSLFGKLRYEGDGEPAYVWQSTGGTDDFEPKFSLTTLIFGTLKGTLYALLFAVPIALLGALYTSQFMHPSLKNKVKPTVEIMAALPSVVLGFIAGLWLAPHLERVLPGTFLLPIVNLVFISLAALVWIQTPTAFRKRVKPGTEVFLLIPIVVFASWFSFYLGGLIEHTFLGGDYRSWLYSVLGLTYDQRNSLLVAYAMGFAVIPIIFTIADDALSRVPSHLVSASLALGATPWQTAMRVVLPAASPAIFSAVMIGFGRAVGETMIVLMATGNTPVMDWSMFNGFRALSANIAVELPEAPVGGTLYRILFLAAFLLFALTFVLNTAAEVVRVRLRKKYQAL